MCYNIFSQFVVDGAVAQLGERLVRNQEVRGSIPLSSTKICAPLCRKLAKGSKGDGEPLTKGSLRASEQATTAETADGRPDSCEKQESSRGTELMRFLGGKYFASFGVNTNSATEAPISLSSTRT